MIIICNACDSAFRIDKSLIDVMGSNARCSKCQNVFLVYPATAENVPVEETTITDFGSETVIQEQASKETDQLPELELDPDLIAIEQHTNASEAYDEDPDLLDLKALYDEDEADELDLSDLETMIDSDEGLISRDVTEENREDFKPDSDHELRVDKEIEMADANDDLDDDNELDFSDLETMLEPDESPKAQTGIDEVDEDPELIISIDNESRGNNESDALDLHKFLESIENPVEEDDNNATLTENAFLSKPDDAGFETPTSDIKEFEIQLGPDGELIEKEVNHSTVELADEGSDPDLSQYEQTGSKKNRNEQISLEDELEITIDQDMGNTTVSLSTEGLIVPDDAEAKANEIANPATKLSTILSKPRARRSALILLSIFLPAIIIFGITLFTELRIPYLDDINLKIPFINTSIKSDKIDPTGNLKIIPIEATVSEKFIENNKIGTMLVITGKVRNEYDHPRSYIKVTAKLYADDKTLVKTAAVYCGNVISEKDLKSLEFSAINRRLQNKPGDQKINVDVKADKTIPFMIVFHRLPDNLAEYTVEVSRSIKNG